MSGCASIRLLSSTALPIWGPLSLLVLSSHCLSSHNLRRRACRRATGRVLRTVSASYRVRVALETADLRVYRPVLGRKENPMPICFDHVSLRVTDLERSITFYRDVMGLELIDRRADDSQAVFRIGEALLVLFCRPEYETVPPEHLERFQDRPRIVIAHPLYTRYDQNLPVVRGRRKGSCDWGVFRLTK